MNLSCIFVFIVSIIVSVDPKQSEKFKCGVKFKSSELSANRTASEPNEWPWLASLHLLLSIKYICGGTIVSEHHVLTAAHCVHYKDYGYLQPDQILVYLGRHSLSSTAETFEWFIPYQMLVHPDWEVSGGRYDADIAVLVAAMPIPFSSTIAPICLWTDLSEDEDYVGTVVGWGEFGTRNISDVPNQLRVQRTSSARCYEDFFQIAAIASSRTFCAGGDQTNNVPCLGFSGGGFFVEENGVWFIQGIVSSTLLTGDYRCNASKYSLFTKIIEFLTWLNVGSYQHDVYFLAYRIYELNRNKREMKLICEPRDLSVRQPSGRVITYSKKFTLDFDLLKVYEQDTVYFPYGFGALYPNLISVVISQSNLKFIDRKSFEDMISVNEVNIKSNPISSIPHDTLFDLKSLERLIIEDCKLTKLHRNLLAKNLNLITLSFKRNQLESLPSDLLRNSLKLKHFIVSENRIKFINDQLFDNLEHLELIDFEQNSLQDISSKAFHHLSKLKELSLDHNRLRSLHVDIFSNNLNLEHFDIKYNQIEALETGIFSKKSKLGAIVLDQNIVKHIDKKLLEDQTNLVLIRLNGISLLALPVDLFKTLTKLMFLEIQTNELKRLHKNLLRENVNLFSFKADFNLIEYLHPSLFRKNAKLGSITLSNNRIKSLAKGLFSRLKNLLIVDLSFNYIASISSDSFEGVNDGLQLLELNENSLDLEKKNFNREILPGRRKIFSSGTEYSEMETIDIMNIHLKLNESKIQEKKQRIDPSKCGRKFKSAGLIVNGTAAGVNEWPWLTSLARSPSKDFFCGGSIVSEHHVLTAAHCLHEKHKGLAVLKPTEFLVYLGKHNLSALLEENSQWFHPHEVLVHPDWATDNVRYDADLAIVVSDFPILFSSTIAPVCLWTELEEDGNYFGTVVGWGSSEKTGLTSHSDVPYQVKVQRVPSEKCYEDQHMMAQIGSSRSFCARGVDEYSGPCNGDSGGGFFFELNGVWYLQGIVSSTMITQTKSCDVSMSALYTKINEFLSWINLRSKAYDIRLRGHLNETRNEDDLITFVTNGLAVIQPSANVILDWKNSMLKVDKVVISKQNVFYLPNGFGRIFPTLEEFEIERSNLRFVERNNFEGMKLLGVLTIHDSPIKNLPGDAFSELTGIHHLKVTKTKIVLLREDLFFNNFELVQLDLSSNLIESLPNDLLKNKTELHTINLSHNQIKFITADNFKNLASLYQIHLGNNRIQEISPQSFSTLKNLEIVLLDANRIKTLLIDTFIQNNELRKLYLESNLINDFPSSLLRKNFKLETLDLQSNKIKELSGSDVSRTFLQSLKRLKQLYLSSMNIKVMPHDFFIEFTSLQMLLLNDNSIDTLNKDLLTKNEQLTDFYISYNKVQEISPKFFHRNSKLENIFIGHNQLTSISSELFKNLTNLIKLGLSFNLIESIDVDTFSDLTSLRELYLSDNNLKLLHENLFSKLKNLVYLEMTSNQIEHLPTGLFRNNHKLVSIVFDYNNLKTIDIEFDPNRGYQRLLFFGNTCVNTGYIGDIVRDNVFKAIPIDVFEEIVKEIVEKCSDRK